MTTADDAEYLRNVMPVVAAYTRQVILAVNLETMLRAAKEAGAVRQAAFIQSLLAARGAFMPIDNELLYGDPASAAQPTGAGS